MKGILSILVIFLVFYKSSESALENAIQEDYDDYNENIYKKYIMIDKQLKSVVDQSLKKLLPYFLEAREHVNMSTTCSTNLFELVMGLRKLTNWSVNFLDAMGKIQAGIQKGNLQMFGEYEECIDTIVTKKGKVDFQGQYCNVIVKPFLPKLKKMPSLNGRLEGLVNATRNTSYFMQEFVSRAQMFYALDINVWLCVPSGCSEQDVSEIVKYSIGDYLSTNVEHCFKKGDIFFWTTRRIIIVCVFVLLGMIVIISTWIDNTSGKWRKNDLGFQSKILQCFSLTRNFPKLVNTDVSEKSVTCLHGIRVLTIFWIILNHEFVLHAAGRTGNHAMNFNKMLLNFFSQIVLNGFVNVEMFFFMSGFVNCYSRMLIKKEGRSQPGIGKIIFHRLWRIYPTYIVAFLFYCLINKAQPYSYNLIRQHTENCDKYWWRNILFISNFFDPEKLCMGHTWFLCADMQLFLVSLFTVPMFLRTPKRAIVLHVGIILITNICSMTWWLSDEGLGPTPLETSIMNENFRAKPVFIYMLPAVHAGSYFIGILFGYVIATKKDLKIPKIAQLVGWLAASLFFISMIFMTLRWNSGIPYTQLESSLYGAWSRTILTLGFSWLVLCCATGHARLINYILSLKLWIPLSRITYMIYLISPLIQAHFYTHVSFPEDFSNIRIIWNYFADILISILMSLALVLLAESPLIAMEKILFGRNQEERKSPPDVNKELSSSNIKENGFHLNDGEVVTVHL